MPVFWRPLLAFALVGLLVACDSDHTQVSPKKAMELLPLSPYRFEFPGRTGTNRNDYFYIAAGPRQDPHFRETLRQSVEAAGAQAASQYALFSIYIYEETGKLNKAFQGSADDLRGVYDSDLVSYARWDAGDLEVFYLIEFGRVVFDLLEGKPVSPSWEFD